MFKLIDFSHIFAHGIGNGILRIFLLLMMVLMIIGFFKFVDWTTKDDGSW